ncbi:MAG: hypothetical protein M1457_12900, partial [bacterium]|nr:hypothetical protein [bacterium]
MRQRLGHAMADAATILTWAVAMAAGAAWTPTPAPSSVGRADGYPRPMLFRQNVPALMFAYGPERMMVSDMHLARRRFSDEAFKKRYSDRPVLIQINSESIGLWGSWESLPPQWFADHGLLRPDRARAPELEIVTNGMYPLPDFPGYWTWEAGAPALDPIPAAGETVPI